LINLIAVSVDSGDGDKVGSWGEIDSLGEVALIVSNGEVLIGVGKNSHLSCGTGGAGNGGGVFGGNRLVFRSGDVERLSGDVNIWSG